MQERDKGRMQATEVMPKHKTATEINQDFAILRNLISESLDKAFLFGFFVGMCVGGLAFGIGLALGIS